MKRRDFLRISLPAFIILANGDIVKAGDKLLGWHNQKTKLRFVVGSDGHYGLVNTPYEEYFSTFVQEVNKQHKEKAFDFCVVNGDVIHDDVSFFPAAKKALDNLAMKYYVSQGNHDHISAEGWQEIWDMPVNYDFSIGKNSFLIGTTSNEQGTYLCPDVKWISQKLEQYKRQDNIFIFLHINPAKQTKHAVDCPELFTVMAKYKNIRAVFNGHDHDEDGIKKRENIPFVFDAHFGGNWGTAYRGFRVVELLEDNSILTYILNPFDKINEATL